MNNPKSIKGLMHVALYVEKLEQCVEFYTKIIGMQIIWQPDPDNVYLTSGSDNLALHRRQHSIQKDHQQLDHIGFALETPQMVDEWFKFLQEKNITIIHPPKDHRDGARSLYIKDPEEITVQLIYFP